MAVYDDPDVNNRKNLINAYDENVSFLYALWFFKVRRFWYWGEKKFVRYVFHMSFF